MTLTKTQTDVLTRFADYGAPVSKWELYGHTPGPGVTDAIHELCEAGLLEAVPYEKGADAHGGTRFKLKPAGYRAINRPVPKPAAAYIPSANKGKRLGVDAPLVANGRRKVG